MSRRSSPTCRASRRSREAHEPREVTAMLNAYFEVAIPPIVRGFGGEVDRIIGDASDGHLQQPRRPARPRACAARAAALAMQRRDGARRRRAPGWPRFRVGVNTGQALGQPARRRGRPHPHGRSATRSTSRRGSRARRRSAASSSARRPRAALARRRVTEPLGAMAVKGKAEPLEPRLLVSLRVSPSRSGVAARAGSRLGLDQRRLAALGNGTSIASKSRGTTVLAKTARASSRTSRGK